VDATKRPTNPRLIIRQELRVVSAVDLVGDALLIGRSSQCDVRLHHDAVSRQHARLEHRGGAWHILDLDSVNGTRLNGRRVQEARLSPGDVIEIRPFAMNYLAGLGTNPDHSICLAPSCDGPSLVGERQPAAQVIRQRLADLYALARLVIHRQDNGSFWHAIHATLQRSLSADRCVLVGFDRSAGMYRLAPRLRTPEGDAPLVVSRSVLNDVIHAGRGALIRSVTDDQRYAGAESLVAGKTGSVICAPVLVSGQTRAVVYAERRQDSPPFTSDDLDFVAAAVDMAAAAVDVDELHARAHELARLRGRVDAAREVQEMLLPSPIPQPAWGCVAAKNVPADQVSGDIYDAVIDSKGRLLTALADVSGKGVPAAFITAIMQNTFRRAVQDIEDLGDIMRRINSTLLDYHLPASYVTMVVCRWSPSGDAVEIANAGHDAPLWVTDAGRIEPFADRIGLALGIADDWPGEIVRRDVSRDRLVLLSSDGATEAMNAERVEFGTVRLGRELLDLSPKEPDAILTDLVDRVRAFCSPNEPEDDITFAIVKRNRC
jgi:serine phosphatase RsbU (regulator of sigma subunit)